MSTLTLFDTNHRFDDLTETVSACRLCSDMEGCTRVLSWANGNPDSEIMFVGEAPGRLGADRTAIPFHGDKAGDNFEKLLELAGLRRSQVFVTNAVLCNPRDEKGNNAPPSSTNLKNCAQNLKKQIALLQPKIVVTLGAAALKSCELIETHGLQLSTAVRTSNNWFGRKLIPLYHPGARAMIHRNFAAQSADYYFVSESFKRLSSQSRAKSAHGVRQPEAPAWAVVKYVLSKLSTTSLFSLHKALYLIDVRAVKESGTRITNFYFIRQKDGPYCVELGGGWHRSFSDEVGYRVISGKPSLTWLGNTLFGQDEHAIGVEETKVIDSVLSSIRGLDDAKLKSKVYLTEPMREVLRAERSGQSQLNRPLF